MLSRNVERFRGGLAFKALRLLHHSTLGSRVIKKKEKKRRRSWPVQGELDFGLDAPPSPSLSLSFSLSLSLARARARSLALSRSTSRSVSPSPSFGSKVDLSKVSSTSDWARI